MTIPRRRIILDVSEDGSISAKTEGIYGEDCLDKIEILENMLDALTIDSVFSKDYFNASSQVTGNEINDLDVTT
jgi:hypothetical protein